MYELCIVSTLFWQYMHFPMQLVLINDIDADMSNVSETN